MFARLLRLFLLMAGLTPCLLYSQPAAMVVGGTEFSFGDIPTAAPVQRLITVKNTGNDTLVIGDVIAICGCTGTLLSSDHIPPGDSGTISISFNPSAFSGHVEKSVHVRTNAPGQPDFTIKFTANVVKALEVEPEYVFVKTTVDSLTKATITLTNVGTKAVKILSVHSSVDLVSVSHDEDEISPGKELALVTTIRPALAGTVTGTIEIDTDHPLQPKLSIRFMAWVKPSTTRHD